MSTHDTLPILQGFLGSASPWQALLARPGWLIRAYTRGVQLDGALVAATAVVSHGKGQIVGADMVMLCAATEYGNATLFVPDTAKISTVDTVAADQINIDDILSAADSDWMLNLGGDTGTISSPNYDGNLQFYEDPAGGDTPTNNYITTGQGGHFRGWLPAGTEVVDLLITNSSDQPQAVIPGVVVGPTLVATLPVYTVANPAEDRDLDVTGNTTAQVAAVLGTLIADLQARGLIG